MKKIALLAVLLIFVAAPELGLAHQQKKATTRILFNSKPNNIEVIHRFFLHDAEEAVNLIFGTIPSILESPESRQLFSSYVMNRFAIQVTEENGSTSELALRYVGEEIDGQFLWVYQETRAVQDLTALTVVNVALRDIWPDQSNLVNIEKDNEIYTLSFVDAAEVLSVDLK
mgnify:CR=1 FL=1|jgi:hypothetical protein|tara:strand:+ start:1305 stop:1817 length:513 start_codon:yes stop_codon:yes gene_type:complete